MSCYHYRRLRFFFHFSQQFSVLFSRRLSFICFYSLFLFKLAGSLFSELIWFELKILELKFLEYSDPFFQCQSDANAFIVLFLVHWRVQLCQFGGMAHTPRTVPFNIHIECKTSGYLQVVIQFFIINWQIALEIEVYLRHLNSLRVINGIVLHFTAFNIATKFAL